MKGERKIKNVTFIENGLVNSDENNILSIWLRAATASLDIL